MRETHIILQDPAELLKLLQDDATLASKQTKCKRRGCAARLIGTDDGAILFKPSINGYSDCTNADGACGCPHAEALAISQVLGRNKSKIQFALLVTMSPCTSCAHLIVACNFITHVFFLRKHSDTRGLDILEAALIEAKQLA